MCVSDSVVCYYEVYFFVCYCVLNEQAPMTTGTIPPDALHLLQGILQCKTRMSSRPISRNEYERGQERRGDETVKQETCVNTYTLYDYATYILNMA